MDIHVLGHLIRGFTAPIWYVLACLVLGACGESSSSGSRAGPLAAQGQISATATPKVSYYAAARFLDQASFGATPETIARVQQLGFSAWIDEQFAMAPTMIDGSWAKNAARTNDDTFALGQRWFGFFQERFYEHVLTGADQLRLRVVWALLQFIVVSDQKISQPYGIVTYYNMLQRQAFGNYADLLHEVSVDPAMGWYLDNNQNRPSGFCPNCAPNENYARELMQLFTLGVNKLSVDGTVVRDAVGRPVPSYSQEDVENLARALTGWEFVWEPDLPFSNNFNYDKPMQARGDAGHDWGSKVLLGTTIPAGGNEREDLDAVIAILMNHQNIAPFVATRLIQHLTTSDPTPAYVKRIADVFRNNGRGVPGDIAAMVKAVLLDPEARKGDSPGMTDARFGKFREPVLWFTALLRGMGCARQPAIPWDPEFRFEPFGQRAGGAPSVFSFYMPTDRVPGSGLLAPEQRLMNSAEFSNRLGVLTAIVRQDAQAIMDAGCSIDDYVRAYERSPRELSALISKRFLRGVMPAPLRDAVEDVAASLTWAGKPEQALTGLLLALSSPSFGVMR